MTNFANNVILLKHNSNNIFPKLQTVKDAKMKEYNVLTQKDKWFSQKFDPEALEKALNSYASQGWKVVSAATATFPGLFSGNREEMIVIMEREKNV